MTDTERLESLIKKSGYKYGGVSALDYYKNIVKNIYQALRNKLDNKSEFLPTEIEAICKLLNITALQDKNDIFFALFVEENSTK